MQKRRHASKYGSDGPQVRLQIMRPPTVPTKRTAGFQERKDSTAAADVTKEETGRQRAGARCTYANRFQSPEESSREDVLLKDFQISCVSNCSCASVG